MPGTYEQGLAAAKTNKEKFGHDFYINIGRKGGSSRTAKTKHKGFASMTPEKRKQAGAKGGRISRKPS